MMSEYVSEGMETVRQGGGQRGCIFSHCKAAWPDSKRALEGVRNTPQQCACTLTHCLPLSLAQGCPKGCNCSQPHFLLLLCRLSQLTCGKKWKEAQRIGSGM